MVILNPAYGGRFKDLTKGSDVDRHNQEGICVCLLPMHMGETEAESPSKSHRTNLGNEDYSREIIWLLSLSNGFLYPLRS